MRLTQQMPAMPYFPLAAFSSMMLALLEWRSSLGFLEAGGGEEAIVLESEGLCGCVYRRRALVGWPCSWRAQKLNWILNECIHGLGVVGEPYKSVAVTNDASLLLPQPR